MQTSENGIAFVASNEGFTPIPTNDNGLLMWGHGHDRQTGESIPVSINETDADTLLRQDLRTRFEPHVNALAPWANQNQFDALVDFCYNDGPVALATMLHHGQSQVAAQLPAWCYEHVNGVLVKSQGLAARRAKEVALFNS